MKRPSSSEISDPFADSPSTLCDEGRVDRLRNTKILSSAKFEKPSLMRLSTQEFRDYRREEVDEGRGGPVPGSWSKMAIVRVHRNAEPKLRWEYASSV